MRRVDVIQRAHERGELLPQPSQEMQLRAMAEDVGGNVAGPSRSNKRKAVLDFESSLTPMPGDYREREESSEEEEPVRTPVNGRGRGTPASKRGRGAAAKKPSVPPSSKRGRGRASVSVNGNGAVEGVGLGGPRRSNRLNVNSPAKVARRR